MNDLNAFLKLRAKELHKTNKELSVSSELSQSNISRIFNNQQQITKIGAITPLLHELKLDKRTVQIKDKDFEDLFAKFIDAIYYITDDRHQLYQQIQNYKNKYYNHPYYLYILLSKFIYTIVFEEGQANVNHILEKFLFIYSSLSNQIKQIFTIFYIAYLNTKSIYLNNSTIEDPLSHFRSKKLEGLFHYYLFFYLVNSGQNHKAISSYQKGKILLQSTKCIHRLSNLEIKYGGLLNQLGFPNESINNNLALLKEYNTKNYRLHNLPIIQHNIGFSYMLLHDYKNALAYFKMVALDIDDNETYFEMAYCCYQLRKNKEARKYIELGTKAEICSECYCYLLDWLSFQLNKKYSIKAFNTLAKTLELYQHQMKEGNKNLIITEMINYYRYNGEHEKALELLISLTFDTLHSPATLDLL